jgi:putative oxidoreductase
MAGRVIERVARLALSGAFVGAGVLKLQDPEAFAFAVDAYRLTPWAVSAGLALYLPWLEILAGLALWARRWKHAALSILLVLCLTFLAVLASAVVRGLPIRCGCLGPGIIPGGLWGSIALDLLLLTAILYSLTRHLADFARPVRVQRSVLFQ